METAKIEFATSRTPSRIDAKRALYQLSYVPHVENCNLVSITLREGTTHIH